MIARTSTAAAQVQRDVPGIARYTEPSRVRNYPHLGYHNIKYKQLWLRYAKHTEQSRIISRARNVLLELGSNRQRMSVAKKGEITFGGRQMLVPRIG